MMNGREGDDELRTNANLVEKAAPDDDGGSRFIAHRSPLYGLKEMSAAAFSRFHR
jgi:hypothetical protein